MPKNPYYDYFSAKPMTFKYAKKLSTLAICYKAIPDPKPTLPKGLLLDLHFQSKYQKMENLASKNILIIY